MQNNKNKIMVIGVIGLILLLGIVGITYAMFTYSKNGVTSKLITGDIYMKYAEGSALNLSGAMPSATYPTATTGNYFQFDITGKNTHETKDISYTLKLAYGDSQASPKQRITDQYLLFKLVEVVNGVESQTPIVEDANYSTIPGSTLTTLTVPHNTTIETTRTFRLYARISESVGIGTNTTYTVEQWNNLYASIKINAEGIEVDAPAPQPATFTGTIYSTSTMPISIGDRVFPTVTETKWIVKLNGEENRELNNDLISGIGTYYWDTHGECTAFLTSVGVTEGVETEYGYTYTCAEKTGTFRGYDYTTQLSDIDRNVYLSHTVVEDIITESYVQFIINNDLKTQWKNNFCSNGKTQEDIITCQTAIDNLVNGTYALRAGIDESSLGTGNQPIYEANINTIKTAFNYAAQPSYFYENNINFVGLVGEISNNIMVFTASAHPDGRNIQAGVAVNIGEVFVCEYDYTDPLSYCEYINY